MVGLILAREIKNTLVIDTFVLSCRALGKNVEDFMFSHLKKYCINKGLRIISAHFNPTPKNQPFLEFLMQNEWEADDLTNTYNFMMTDKSKTMLIKK
jgi:predicted enzyme involved in methoxymalonyl-ACP biosynthesis